MITRVEAVNYRCLRNISQPLDGFHVMAGPNGSGKSTFLEVVKILGAFAEGGLDAVWTESRAQQFEELLFQGGGLSFQLAVEIKIPESLLDSLGRKNGHRKQFIRYEVQIGKKTGTSNVQIEWENLWLLDQTPEVKRSQIVQTELTFPSSSISDRSLISGKTRTPAGWRKIASKTSRENSNFQSETSDWNFTLKNGARRSALSSLPEDERFGLAGWAKSILTQGVQKLMLRSDLMQKSCGPLRDTRFAPDGSTLPLVVAELKKHPSNFESWLEHLRTILPIKDIDVVVRDEDKHSYLHVTYNTGFPVPSWHLSDGTLRLLALTLLAYVESPGKIYLIEEPENGVHPRAVEAVYKSLTSIYDGQALVATHSPILVGLIRPEQLLCFSRNPAGETDIIRGSQHPKLKDWKEGFRLAQMFASGILS